MRMKEGWEGNKQYIFGYWSRIHERTISLSLLDIILRALRLEVSVYYVYITNQFQTTFAVSRGDYEWQGGKS
jgi:hypothetical protein